MLDINDKLDIAQFLIDLVNTSRNWRWIPVNEQLPPLFENVAVIGIVEKLNISPQVWQARRFSGFLNGYPGQNEGNEPSWQWLTVTDYAVGDVQFWMPLPKKEGVI